ncbi:MAG: subclass B3 metallo-beta-lactamase BJP-1 [Parasphingorhabdus sp.]
MRIFKRILVSGSLVSLIACVQAQSADNPKPSDPIATIDNLAEKGIPKALDPKIAFPSWYAPIEPFRIIGDEKLGIYYVGTEGLAMYFIPTDEGHIVLDGGMPDQGSYVADAIRKLGYDPKDIAVLLNSHAHLDHSGGLAELQELSGAQLIASEGDRSALEGGFYLGSEQDTNLNAPPVQVNIGFSGGFKFEQGGVSMAAKVTPGHSRGCTSWTMNIEQGGKSHEVLFFCSATVAANRLIGPPQYEGIVDDYRKTFAMTKDWKPDVFLSNHPQFFGFKVKREKLLAGDPLAFVGNEDFPKFIAKMAVDFETGLEKQRLKHNAIMSE